MRCGLAPGELLLDPGPDLRHLAEPLVKYAARLARFGRPRLGAGELGLVAAELGGEQLRPQLRRLALESGVDVRGLGLALERAQRLARLALDVEGAVEVVLGALELELRRRRRLRGLPSPAASSTSSRRSRGAESTIPRPGPG